MRLGDYPPSLEEFVHPSTPEYGWRFYRFTNTAGLCPFFHAFRFTQVFFFLFNSRRFDVNYAFRVLERVPSFPHFLSLETLFCYFHREREIDKIK